MTEQMLYDRMSQMIRVGFVNARQPEKMRVKVTLNDTVGSPLVTDWLPVLCPRACGDMQYDLPDIGDQVLCLFLAYGLEQGFVLGSMYGRQTPPVSSGDKWHRTFSDGAVLEYDRASHSLTANIPGTANIKCSQSITLEAPVIYLRGTLQHTHTDGSPGKSVFSGGMEVMNGGINVMDGDVIASGVSLTSHRTEGVEAGNGTSSHPVGGSSESAGTAAKEIPAIGTAAFILWVARHLEALAEEVEKKGTDTDNLIMCLPKIAAHMAEETISEDNKIGWIYLHDMFEKWLSGTANKNPLENPHPFWVDIEWALSYVRTNFEFLSLLQKNYLFSQNARNELVKVLQASNIIPAKEKTFFDYTEVSWKKYKDSYFQRINVPSMIAFPPDGLMAAMGDFELRALAKGYVEPEESGYLIVISGISVFIWDSFNFEGSANLGYWRCSPPNFSYSDFENATELSNADFNYFRDYFSHGDDFLVLSKPYKVEPPVIFSYHWEP